MGAGTEKDHYCQDAGEKFIVWQLQKIAVERGKSISGSYQREFEDFFEYVKERNIEEDFYETDYCKIYKKNVEPFFDALEEAHPKSSFNFVDVEKEFRDQNKKGDFVIQFDDGTEEQSVSLKVYRKGYSRPQMCSSTWLSFTSNFFLDKVTVGVYRRKDGTTYNCRGKNYIQNIHEDLLERGHITPQMREYLDFIEAIGEYLKTFYVDSDHAEFWHNVESNWKDDCEQYGYKARDLAYNVLNSAPRDIIKNRVIEMTGLDFKEHVLLLDKKGFLCSLFDKRLQIMAKRITSSDCQLKLRKVAKNLFVDLADKHGKIIEVQIPFTLNRNGGWNLPKEEYEGPRFHEREKTDLHYGQRRPSKSKEIATSINTFLNLKKSLEDAPTEWGEDAV